MENNNNGDTVKLAQSLKTPYMTVLVVDDDKMIREIVIQHLRRIGFNKFVEAGNGTEAYKHIIDPLQKVDLIICDWEMPKTDGLTFLRAVRSSRLRYDTPFIMVTSQQSHERVKISQARDHQVNAYIVKPFHAEILRDKVLQVLQETAERKEKAS